jgi:hypothetical protein
MSSTTFSGPVTSTNGFVGAVTGNVTGFALMAQSAVIDIAGATSANQVVATIPANSQIVDAILNVTTANDDGTASTVAVGTSAVAATTITASSTLGVTGDADLLGTANVIIIPTSDPGVTGAIWNNGGTLAVSA